MGLDITSENHHFSSPYSTFNQMREYLGELIGVKLREFEGFEGNIPFSTLNDDLKILLDHSDCDGEISLDDAKKLSMRLTELLPKIEHAWFNERTKILIDVLNDNYNNKQITKFS